MEIIYTGAMYTCPNCHATRYQVKDGLTSAASQRVRCRTCGKQYMPQTKPQGYAPEHHMQALKLYLDGMNFRRIARQIGVYYQPSAPPVPKHVDIVELDELYTFIERKKPACTS